jgi:single-strand DNA-binding protein
MRSLNRVMLIGNLGIDPEIRSTPSGQTVANFRMATSETFGGRDGGQVQERTEWHRIVAWGKLAEIVRDYLRKGQKVYIEGRIQTREWTDQQGNKRYTTEVVAQSMLMLSARSDSGGSGGGGEAGGYAGGHAGGRAEGRGQGRPLPASPLDQLPRSGMDDGGDGPQFIEPGVDLGTDDNDLPF